MTDLRLYYPGICGNATSPKARATARNIKETAKQYIVYGCNVEITESKASGIRFGSSELRFWKHTGKPVGNESGWRIDRF